MNREKFMEERKRGPFNEVSLGYRCVKLYCPAEIAQAQVGTSVDSNGRNLTGSNHGDWNRNWLVIAVDDEVGDPIFTDLSSNELPVYTAAHGEGTWDPQMISPSYHGFIACLQEIRRLSKERENPVKLERHPITDKERETTLECIADNNNGELAEFWESWLES